MVAILPKALDDIISIPLERKYNPNNNIKISFKKKIITKDLGRKLFNPKNKRLIKIIILSETGSKIFPNLVTCSNLRAKYPSKISLNAERIKRIKAEKKLFLIKNIV